MTRRAAAGVAPLVIPALEEVLPPGVDPAQARDWCIEEGTRDNAIARRNVLAALWAGRLMRLGGEALTAYAAQVHFSDFAVPGDDDIVGRLVFDLEAAGVAIPPGTVRDLLAACHKQALRETAVTD
jgi:hypothetical protein